ncbi:MAG TPA: sugar ABC transporter substrate-binding protein [Clostridiales bacterium]|nr:sugar ABC transporter substrate-binding protein [Clostridiales bacterium]
MKKKSLSAVLGLILAFSVEAGCAATKPAKSVNSQVSASSKSPGDIKSLSFIDVSPSPERQAYFEKIFKKFKSETGITVSYQSVPWDDAANKLAVMGTSHQLPDVMTTWAGWLGQFTSAKLVVPIDNYIASQKDEYTKAVTNIVWKSEKQLYGATYTVPDGMMVKGVFVRKDWCKEAGISLDPDKGWSYDEYFNVCKKLTNPSKRHYGVAYRGARGAFDPIMVYLEGFNGGKLYDNQGNILINSKECQEAFKKWTDLYLKGYAPKDSVNWGFTEMVDNFTGGLVGTLINDSEVAPTCAKNMKADQWMVMPMPTSKDGKIYNTINSPYAYTISGDCKSPQAAWKLIAFLNRSDNNIEYCKMGGLIPVKKDVSDDATYGESGPYSAFVKQLNNPNVVVPCAFGPFDYTDMHQGMMHQEIQKYLLGQQKAETALSKITDELQKRMKNYLKEHPSASVEEPKSIS